MITDRQLRDYVEGDVSNSARYALEASLPFDPVSMQLLTDQLRIHHALAAMSANSAERAYARRRILEALGIPVSGIPREAATHAAPRSRPPRRPPKHRRRHFVVPLVVTATILAAIAYVLLQPGGNSADFGSLPELAGDVSLVRSGNPLDLSEGIGIRAQDVLTLDSGAAATVLLEDGSRIKFSGPAVVTAVATAGEIAGDKRRGIHLRIERGDFVAAFQPQMRRTFTLGTPHLLMVPTGGTWRASVRAEGTRLEVASGVLRVVDLQGATRVLQPGDTLFVKAEGSEAR